LNYPAIKEGLVAWAVAVTGLSWVVFEHDPQPVPNMQAVYLNVRSTHSVGVDDSFSEYDETARTFTETIRGGREIALTFQVDSFDMTAANNALTVITRAQTRMRFDSSEEILRDCGLALATIGDPVDASYEADDRMVSRYSMDVLFNAVSSETDLPMPTIETVELSREIRDVNGTVLE
jgi:hypothetical protein